MFLHELLFKNVSSWHDKYKMLRKICLYIAVSCLFMYDQLRKYPTPTNIQGLSRTQLHIYVASYLVHGTSNVSMPNCGDK